MPSIFPIPTCTVAAISLSFFFDAWITTWSPNLDVLQCNRRIHLGVLRVGGRRYDLRLSVCRGHRDGTVGDAGNGSPDVFHPIVRVGVAHHEQEQDKSCK
jgi:hypothetical protein